MVVVVHVSLVCLLLTILRVINDEYRSNAMNSLELSD